MNIRVARELLHTYVREVFGGASGNRRRGAFITGSDFLIDGGATASFFYGPPKPAK